MFTSMTSLKPAEKPRKQVLLFPLLKNRTPRPAEVKRTTVLRFSPHVDGVSPAGRQACHACCFLQPLSLSFLCSIRAAPSLPFFPDVSSPPVVPTLFSTSEAADLSLSPEYVFSARPHISEVTYIVKQKKEAQ